MKKTSLTLSILLMSMGTWAEFSDEQLDLADLNSDGTINIVDIVQLINIILQNIFIVFVN